MAESESEEESEEEEILSLDAVQNEFKAKVGNKPHSVQQMLAFCKQNNIPWKFRDINQWWPTRPEPEERPAQIAVNADDYKADNENGNDNDNSDDENSDNDNDNNENNTDESNTTDNDSPTEDRNIFNDDGGIIYGGYDNNIFMKGKSALKAHYITYGDAYDSFDPRDDNDPQSIADHAAAEAAEQAENDDITYTFGMDDGGGIPIENADLVEADTAEEACFWTQANCKSTESFPFC
eukprot:559291_1